MGLNIHNSLYYPTRW